MPAAPAQPGHCILSHGGFDRGADAGHMAALEDAAGRLGWSCDRPGYVDLDDLGDVSARLDRLLGLARDAAARGPLVLAGASVGAWSSGRASLQVPVAGLFLMSPPVRMHDAPSLDAAAVPLAIVHGWRDEWIPAAQVVDWAGTRRDELLLVDDTHRLPANVRTCGTAFEAFLVALMAGVG